MKYLGGSETDREEDKLQTLGASSSLHEGANSALAIKDLIVETIFQASKFNTFFAPLLVSTQWKMGKLLLTVGAFHLHVNFWLTVCYGLTYCKQMTPAVTKRLDCK